MYSVIVFLKLKIKNYYKLYIHDIIVELFLIIFSFSFLLLFNIEMEINN